MKDNHIHILNKILTNLRYSDISPSQLYNQSQTAKARLRVKEILSEHEPILFDVKSLYPSAKVDLNSPEFAKFHTILYADTSEAYCSICGWIPLTDNCPSLKVK